MKLISALLIAGAVVLAFAGGVYVGSPDYYKVSPTKHMVIQKYCDPIPVDKTRQPDTHEL